ncbi:MAG: tetratricopeptide repeat protein [Acidobacteriia bacterium]|nr:tetratricopeptide repeat protein [Terriglobia bacterium]
MMRRFSPSLVTVSILSFLFVVFLQAQEVRNQDVPEVRGIKTPLGQRPLVPLSPQEIFKRVSPSVMVVESLEAKGSVAAFGSGVIIATGRVVTNRHVIENGVSFRVGHAGKTWPARLVKVDADHDLAELSVAGLAAPAVQVRDSSTLAVGEKVYAIGAPQGLELTISEGLISGLRDFDKDRVIQTSAAISPGSSGGGLFDAEGQLVGITTFYLKEGQSLNFALPGEWTLALDRQPATAAPAARGNSPAFQCFVWLVKGYEAQKAGKYEEAVSAYREAIRLKPDFAVEWYNLGVSYFNLGQYEKAISALQEAIRLRPGDADAWYNLGTTYGRLRQYDKAIDALQEAIRLKSDHAEAWYNLGTFYGSLGQYEKAISALQEAIRLKPDDADPWVNLGTFYSSLGQYDEEVSALQEAIRLKPDHADTWYNLGTAYGSHGQYDKEVSALREAIRLKPDHADAWVNLGTAYRRLGQFDKAISATQDAIRLKPDDAEAWYNLGLYYNQNGQRSDVVKVYEKLKTLDPKTADKFFQKVVLP